MKFTNEINFMSKRKLNKLVIKRETQHSENINENEKTKPMKKEEERKKKQNKKNTRTFKEARKFSCIESVCLSTDEAVSFLLWVNCKNTKNSMKSQL